MLQLPERQDTTTPHDIPPNLNFTWEVIEHFERNMTIQLDFEEKDQVTLAAFDILRVRVIDLDQNLRAIDTKRPIVPE